MKTRKPATPFTPLEMRSFVMPLTLASILVLAGMVTEVIRTPSALRETLLFYGIVAGLYLVIINVLFVRLIIIRKINGVLNAVISGIGLGALSLILPQHLGDASHTLIVFIAITIAILSGRWYAYLFLLIILLMSLPINYLPMNGVEEMTDYFTPLFVSVIIIEVALRIQNITKQHIHRLETINKVSRQISQSLNTEETLVLLNATIQETLNADTYFIGILKNDEIKLELFYDDGEYFTDTYAPLEGTLSGWVIKNQKELFLPDLREEVQLHGIQSFIMGKEKTSLSWIGVPLNAENVTGILALASYSPNAFDRADFELLVSLGQHVTLALDNTIRHAQVEKQARLDSLTGVYNHGYFLNTLAEQAKKALETQTPLSVIMLDVDYFKQYNDTHGHLVGDHILNSLCTAIQDNIKQTDAVGRWGGEEFVISLPGATGKQALTIAERISATLSATHVEDRNKKTVPAPTISQGIAVYLHDTNDTDEIYQLIDIADKRLYVAKERGRNQIEPSAEFWQE